MSRFGGGVQDVPGRFPSGRYGRSLMMARQLT